MYFPVKETDVMEESREISFIQLIRVAFGKKLRLLIITAVFAVAGLLFFKKVYNPGNTYYSTEFNLFVQGLEEGMYINGAAFNFEDMVSLEALRSVKEMDSDFDSIDVESMYNRNSISITHVRDASVTKEEKYLYYRISAASSNFKSASQAKKFLQYLAEQPLSTTLKLSDSTKYKYNLKMFDESESFDKQLTYLEAQYALLDAKYDALMLYYGDISLRDGDTITDKKKAMEVFFENNSFAYLRYEQEQYGYVLNKGSNVENLKLTKMDLEKQFKYNEMELEKLEGSITALVGTVGTGLQSAEIDSYNSRITELIAKNIEITRKIDNIDLQLQNVSNKDNTKFAEKLLYYRTTLEKYTDSYQLQEYEVVSSNSKVFYTKPSVISEGGSMGTVKGAAIAGIIGLLLGCFVNLICGFKDVYKDPYEEMLAAEEKKNAEKNADDNKAESDEQ